MFTRLSNLQIINDKKSEGKKFKKIWREKVLKSFYAFTLFTPKGNYLIIKNEKTVFCKSFLRLPN